MTSAIAENTVNQMDALELLRQLPEASVDCVLTDPPYGTTACAWDTPIDLVAWWAAVRRVVKRNAAIVMTASQPFTSALVMSNPKMFRYEWMWDKLSLTGFLDAQRRPLRKHENIVVFSEQSPAYYPQMTIGRPYTHKESGGTPVYGGHEQMATLNNGLRFPVSVVTYSNANSDNKEHPTQKPVALFEYLIRTYTRLGDLVVDPFGGSGTTAVAARNLGRRWITGDTDAGYCAIMRRRLSEPYTPQLFAEEADAVDDAPRQVEMFEATP